MDILLDIVFPAIDETNNTLPEKFKLTKATDTVLMGEGATLDSIQLTSFVFTVEDIILDLTGQEISLITKDSMSRMVSPFLTVGHFASYLKERVDALSVGA